MSGRSFCGDENHYTKIFLKKVSPNLFIFFSINLHRSLMISNNFEIERDKINFRSNVML